MQTHQLEDLTLLLIRDADEPEMWLDRWAVSYPMVRVAEAARTQRIERSAGRASDRPGRASTAIMWRWWRTARVCRPGSRGFIWPMSTHSGGFKHDAGVAAAEARFPMMIATRCNACAAIAGKPRW